MVTRRSLSDCSNSTSDANDDGQDTVSVATSDSEESTASNHDELVLSQDVNKDKPGFSNIAVTNSTDIHFGNKTYYQGPVTIKQFLYQNPQISNEVSDDNNDKLAIKNDTLVLDSVPDTVIIGKDNPSFVPDTVGIKLKDIEKQINGDVTHTEPAEVRKGTRWLRNFSRQQVISVLVAVVLLISLVTLLRVFLTKHQATDPVSNPGLIGDSDEAQSGSPALYPIDPNGTVTLPDKVYIVPRREWLAKPPAEPATPLQLPVPYVIIMHTAQETCSDQATCSFHVRQAQSFHVDSRGWDDIGYSFLVGGDGYAYEGRGWKSVGAQVYGYNTKCIGIAFIGTFNTIMPPERQINAAKKLIELGVKEGYIAKDYKLLAARQLQTTQSPGLLLYEDVKKWPHWSQTP